ncbi:DNA polymerase III subunit epsilon [Rhodobaculum claviforme]|uniref:DNA polymerase III subunit epsilon n=1 Tax=Rhodobaculum claviforme TaxID=1549854 RepID=A0A934WIQ1_9RHOB|nr:DNA polymerase III subunit epsilon [Rhodobaculum claviforme]MBK5927032.1 DNA polymerase III subunit epsilon [Rhodobaculum claviforme]
MRELVLDTETTGLDPAEGHRIVEIAAVELVNHVTTGRTWHEYINPGRPVPAEAQEVHGLDDAFLADKPPFERVVDSFLAFVGDARLVIHNAAFDMRFLNAELSRAGRPALPSDRALDTLAMARARFPGSPASLDALCRRFGVNNAAREKHGALLDCELLAEVYLELIGGRQPDFQLATRTTGMARRTDSAWRIPPRPRPLPARITDTEAEAHARLREKLGADAVWSRFD